MVQLIETVIENEKSRGETSRIGDPLPGEKIRWKVPIEKRASFWYAMGVLIIVGSIIHRIIVGSIIIGTIIDHPSSERAHPESPAPAKLESSEFVSCGPQGSSPSLNLNEADYNWERIKRIIDEFERARQARTLH